MSANWFSTKESATSLLNKRGPTTESVSSGWSATRFSHWLSQQQNDLTSMEAIRRSFEKFTNLASSTNSVCSNWNTVQFALLFEALRNLSSLPDGDEYRINETAAKRAEEVLEFLKMLPRAEAPRIFTQGDDCVVFTWNMGNIKRNIITDSDEINLIYVDREGGYGDETRLDDGGDLSFKLILENIEPTL